MRKYARFNIDAIRRSLEAVKADFVGINARLDNRREMMTEELVANILQAYEYLNDLLDKRIELFSPAGMYSMLELNHIVLCGSDPARRSEYFRHIQETRRRFQSIIHDIMRWYERKGRRQQIFKRATHFYIKALSQPQLFIEGNHRTENIIVNYMLFCEDEPPFILSVENALEYFNPSTRIKYSSKNSLIDNTTAPHAKEFRELLEKHVDPHYVIMNERKKQ